MKIQEHFHVNGIFHDDKDNRMKVYKRISRFSMHMRGDGGGVPNHRPKICSSPPVDSTHQIFIPIVILCFCLFLIQNI